MAKDLLYKAAVGTLLFLVAFFVSAVIFSQVLLKSEVVTVPDVTGRTVAQARSELLKKDLSLAQKGSEPSDRLDRGLIVRQDPAAGSRVRITRPVQVFISSGSGTATVPDLAGRTLDEALTLLQSVGLTKGQLSQVHTSQRPAGRVLDQRPAPGAVVERGGAVGLLLSQGDVDPRYVMPDLIGRRAAGVISGLDARGFKVADIRYVYYPGAAAGLIVKQEPPNGYRIQKRNRISFEVSR
ncbi:MAG TPA: PASTA domain-containing protein [Candidatus Aminicenantes bacterium]|nr:PASTA domain-containing protein [Candidatus Aminicenantes bacterium]HRY66288.1 PASTA domain-containing protein [Candidatus Aminicenantes bacterium]HRZ73192.1 PASTA domain-containing protein [Candidatus Aminicenantes bacterium]